MQILPGRESNSRNVFAGGGTSWGYRLCNFESLEKCPGPFFRIKSFPDCEEEFFVWLPRLEFVKSGRKYTLWAANFE